MAAIILLLLTPPDGLLWKLIKKGKVLSYSIDGPELLAFRDVSITVNAVPTSQLFMYRIRLWNSGGVPLKDVPVILVFDKSGKDFQIISVRHAKRAFLFGGIQEQNIDATSKCFVYGLIDLGDQDIITLVTNAGPALELSAKVESMRVKRIE